MRQALTLLFAGGLLWGADTCRDLPDAHVGPGLPEQASSAIASRLTVHADVAPFRISIRKLAPPDADHVADIEVSRCSDGRTIQTLPVLGADQPLVARSFHAQDINFDGYLDIGVLVEYGGKWGSESWWVFDPTAGKFVQNELTRQLRELKANAYEVDPLKREIRTGYLTQPSGCGGTGDRYRVQEHARLVLVHREAARPTASGCEVVVSDLLEGKMKISEVRRFVNGKRQ